MASRASMIPENENIKRLFEAIGENQFSVKEMNATEDLYLTKFFAIYERTYGSAKIGFSVLYPYLRIDKYNL